MNDYTKKEIEGASRRGSSVDTIRDTATAQSRTIKSTTHSFYNQVGTEGDGINFTSMATTSAGSGGGGSSLLGLEVLRANGEYIYIPKANIVADFDPATDTYWSVVFAVENGIFTGTYTFDELEDQWEEDENGDQTKYRLRIITGVEESIFTGDSSDTDILSIQLSNYGQYRESIICRDGEPVTVLTKSS